ncbi:MAG: non-homologous end-joining DNA ligase [Archangium sp.]|nr:non-homologous end-joining DNA ligase [Archangium sp.]
MPARRGKRERWAPAPTGPSARNLAAQHRLSPLRQHQGAFSDGEWLLEIAWSGYRLVASKLGDDVGLYADDLREWTRPCAAIALAIGDLPANELVLEGTVCVLDAQGRPDFEALRARVATGEGGPLVFMVSDCLHLDGPLGALPLRARRARLTQLLSARQRSLSISEGLEGEVEQVLSSLRGLGLPGVVARRLDDAAREGLVLAAGHEPVPLSRSLSAAPKVTNAAKVLFPRDGFTKDDLAAYYRDVAPVLLAHMRERPIVGQRWPDGIDDFTWYQHRVPPRAPDYVKSVRIEGDRRLLVESPDALGWMVNQAVLTFHGWASRVGSLAAPDWAIIDLDPGTSTTWAQLIEVANAVRALLELLEVPSVVKTSGQKGLHVLVPVAPGHTTAQTHEFSERVCKLVARLKPDLVSLVAETAPRRGRLYLDCVQNYAGKSLVLPYSVRAVDGAPVSTPLTWAEVTDSLDPKAFTLRTLRARLDARGDLFASALGGTSQLAAVLERLRTQS